MKLKSIMKPRTPVVEPGAYLAVCVGVVFIGEQYVPPYKEREQGKYENRVMFVWDLPSELDADGAPKQLSREFNATSSPNGSLSAVMSAWNSKTYSKTELEALDLYDQLGKPCQLTVNVTENGYASVYAVAPLAKGIPAPVSSTPFITFDVNEWSDEGFAALPEFFQKKIQNSTEYQKLHAPEDVVDFPDAPEAPSAAEGACPI